jgi:hypothetical protein
MKYLPQFYGKNLSDDDALVFPQWCFGYSASEVFNSGCWYMWLCRMFGAVPAIQDDATCLDTYRLLFGVCTDLLKEFYDDPIFPWPEKGLRLDFQYDPCLPWLLFLLEESPQRKDFGGVLLIDDVGIASSVVLRSLRDSLLDQDTTKAPQQADNKADEDDADDGVLLDGLYRADALFVWNGKRYEWLTETMMDVLELLCKCYPEPVKPSAIEHKIGSIPEGGFKKVFRVNRKDQKGLHEVVSIISGRASKGWYLIK